MMTKIVYNNCYGGFSLSPEAIARYAELKGITLYEQRNPDFPEMDGLVIYYLDEEHTEHWSDHNIPRADAHLVQVVEELGAKAGGRFAELAIAELPAGTKYRIDEYDGDEAVMTPDDYEWETA